MSEIDPDVFCCELSVQEDLLDLELAPLLAGEEIHRAQRHREPIYLVCTNGRRDRCCARYGLELYRALVAVAGDAVWQTTHVGGHRFAANVATFPDGSYYGRVLPAEVAAVTAARRRGELYLDRLRGGSVTSRWCRPPTASGSRRPLSEGVTMIAVPNRIYVHPDYAEAFEARFRNRPGMVDQMEGFISNQVLRPTAEGDPYVVLTFWESRDAFLNWVDSDAFKQGHARSGTIPREAFPRESKLEIHEVISQSEK